MPDKLHILGTRLAAIVARRIVNRLMGELQDGTESPFPRQNRCIDGSLPPAGKGITVTYRRVLRHPTLAQWAVVLDDDVRARIAGAMARLTPAQRTALRNAVAGAVDWTAEWDDATEDDDDS